MFPSVFSLLNLISINSDFPRKVSIFSGDIGLIGRLINVQAFAEDVEIITDMIAAVFSLKNI